MRKMRKFMSIMLVLVLSICGATMSVSASSYTVVEGDVLWKIAEANGLTWEQLAESNNIVNPNMIYPGQVLTTDFPVVQAEATTSTEDSNPEMVNITLLSTSDMHGNIMGYVYEDEKYSDKDGMVRIATYVNSVREANANVILIDNGDTIQGNILTDDILATNLDKKNSVIAAMNYMKYDAMVLGNHEFNFGLEVVDKVIEEADFDVLAANIYKDGVRIAKPYTIIEREGVKIAFIGLGNPNILTWDGDKLEGVTTTGIGEEVEKLIAYIDANEVVDAKIVVAHVSETSEFYDGTNKDAGLAAIEAYPELPVLILGHAHTEFNKMVGDTIVIAVKNNAGSVARTDLIFAKENGKFVMVEKKAEVVTMEGIEKDATIVEMTTPIHEETINYIKGAGTGEQAGEVVPIAIATEKFQPEDEINGIPQGKLEDTAVLDLINNIQLDVTGADVSAAALFKDTSDLPKGAITYGNIFDIYKFANIIYKVEITGAQLKAYMEWSAQHYNQAEEGDITISFNPDVPGYLYDMFQGVEYKIDVSKPVGERIVDIVFKGEPLLETTALTLAVNNYRFSGLTSAGILTGAPVWTSPLSVRDYIKAYMEEEGSISPSVDYNWEVIGIDYNHVDRQRIIDEVNAKLSDETTTDERYDKAYYYNHSINIYTYDSKE